MIFNKSKEETVGNDFVYSQLLKSVKEFALIMTDIEGFILEWNKGAEKIFKYSEEEVKGENISFIYKNNDSRSLKKELAKALETGEYNFETVRITKEESPFIADVTIIPLFYEDKKLFGYSFLIKNLSYYPGSQVPQKLIRLNKELEEEIELRIKVERSLREKEKEQLDLLEHAPVGIIWTSSSDEIKLVNKTLMELWHYEKEDLANKNISLLFLKKDEAKILLSDTKSGRLVNNYKTVFLNKFGEQRNVSINTSAYSLEDQVIHHRWYIQDITDKIKGEKAIAEKERLGRILDDSSNEIYIIDCKTKHFVHVNQGALQNLGYTPEEILEMTPLHIAPEFNAEKFEQMIGPVIRGERDTLFLESIHKRKDGSIYPVEVRLQLNNSEERPVLVAIIMDISERKRTQNKLERMLRDNKIARAKAEQAADKFILLAKCSEILNSSINYKTTLTNAAKLLVPQLADWIAIDLVDEKKNIYRVALQHANPGLKDAAKQLMKYVPRKEINVGAVAVVETGKSLFYQDVKQAQIEKYSTDKTHFKLAKKLGIQSSLLVPLKVRNYVLGCLTLVYSGKNYTPEELSLAEEIAKRMAVAIENAKLFTEVQKLNTQLLKRAEELTASNSELERFAYVASHDLQEPLRVITSFLQLLDKKCGEQLDVKAKEYISYAVDGSMRMRQLIRDLLNYSRIDSGRSIRTKVDLNVVLNEVVNNLSTSVIENKAVLDISELPEIKANKAQMVQLFQNLISNSIKYRKKDRQPKITITCNNKMNSHQITIADNGIGVAESYHNRIFEMFQRLHTRDEYTGTGIGLAICKKIMDHHNGSIDIVSKEGEGAKFILSFHKE